MGLGLVWARRSDKEEEEISPSETPWASPAATGRRAAEKIQIQQLLL